MTALDWLGDIGGALVELFPQRRIICTTQAGVLWRFGKNPRILGPGWYLWWPLISELQVMNVVTETIDISPQTIKTADDKTVGVSGWITYRITDPLLVATEFVDYESTLQETAAGTLASVVSQFSSKITMSQLNKELRKALKDNFVTKGIQIQDFALSDYFEVRFPLGLWQTN